MLIGKDGFPIPDSTQRKTDKYICICPICVGANAFAKSIKNGNWQVKCANCMTVMFLNSATSINLFRGMQKLFNSDPQHQIKHTEGIVGYAPSEGD